MEISKLKVGHTFHGDSEELSGLANDNIFAKSDTIFFTVELKLCGGYEIKEYSDIKSALEYSLHHNLVYRFIEYTDIEGNRKIFVLHHIIGSDKVVGYQNFYGIGGDWKLYVNSKVDIVLQHIEFAKVDITVRFRHFPLGNEFYVYLSCLIYVATNYKLVTEKEITTTFQMIIDCVTK